MDALERGKQHPSNDQKGAYRTAWAKGYAEGHKGPVFSVNEYEPESAWGKAFHAGWATACKELVESERDDGPEYYDPDAESDQFADSCPLADVMLTLQTLRDAYADEDNLKGASMAQAARHALQPLKPPGYVAPPPPPAIPQRPLRGPRVCRRSGCGTVLGLNDVNCRLCGTYQPPPSMARRVR